MSARGVDIAFHVAAAATLLDVFAALRTSLVCLLRANLVPDAALPGQSATILAMRAAGPRMALAGVCVLAVRVGSPEAFVALGTVAALLQGFDAAVGAVQGDVAATILPTALAMLQCLAVIMLGNAMPPRGRTGQR